MNVLKSLWRWLGVTFTPAKVGKEEDFCRDPSESTKGSRCLKSTSPCSLPSRRNFWLGVANGALHRLGFTFSDPSLVLPWFLSELTNSSLLIGFLPSIQSAGWALPQALMARYAQRQSRQKPLYVRTAVLRQICWLILILAVALLPSSWPRLTVIAFVILYTAVALIHGARALAWLEMVSKTIDQRHRASHFAMRGLFGGILAVGGGYVVRWIMKQGLYFPLNYVLLFSLDWILMSLSAFSYALTVEPAEPSKETECQLPSVGRHLQRGFHLVREDRGYCFYLLLRVCARLALIAVPFYIIYAKEMLNAPPEMLGVFIIARALTEIIGNPLWGYIGDRWGAGILVMISAAASFATPTAALLIPRIPLSPFALMLPHTLTSVQSRRMLFAMVFVLGGVVTSTQQPGHITFMLNIIPERQRSIYLGFANTLFGVFAFTPFLGGAVVEAFSLEMVLTLASSFGFVAFLMSLRLRKALEST